MITEAAEKTKAAEKTEAEEVEADDQIINEARERAQACLDNYPEDIQEQAILGLAFGSDAAGEKIEPGDIGQEETKIPAGLLEMLESAPSESIAMAYVLMAMVPKDGKVRDSVIGWLEEEMEPFHAGNFNGLDVESEQLPIREWMAFGLGMSVCENE
jgi:hypothetical protein